MISKILSKYYYNMSRKQKIVKVSEYNPARNQLDTTKESSLRSQKYHEDCF